MAFRLEWYAELLKRLQTSGRSIRTVADFLQRPDQISIVLRHDVDRAIGRAVRLAELEHKMGLRSSFYFRHGTTGFPVDAIRAVAAMGHETGFHYETLSVAKGDITDAIKIFLQQLSEFRKVALCRTICAHGKPLSRWFSGDIAAEFLGSAPDIIGDASASMPVEKITYLTDAGGRWNDPALNLRDRIGDMLANYDPLVTVQLEKLLTHNSTLYISTHPERWRSSIAGYLAQSGIDLGVGIIKKFLRVVRA